MFAIYISNKEFKYIKNFHKSIGKRQSNRNMDKRLEQTFHKSKFKWPLSV